MVERGRGVFSILPAVLLLTACMSSSPAPPPETTNPTTGEPALQGARYESMRVLARRLAERAAVAAEQRPGAGEVNPSGLEDLVGRSRDFHRRLDDYSNPPRYVRSEVRGLDALVREIDGRVRYARPSDRFGRSWRDVLDAMDRMNRLAAGEDVDLPPSSPTGREEPVFPAGPTSSSEETWRTGSVLRDSELEEFRRASRELAVRATLASETAERTGGGSETERRLLRDLQDLRARARDLERRGDSSALDRGQLRPVLDRLNDDARRIDRELRDGGHYTRIWSDWTEVLLILRRMSELIR